MSTTSRSAIARSGVNVRNTFSLGFHIAFAFVVLLFIATLLNAYSAADVRAICVNRGGVQQVADATWTAQHGKALVVCRNGYAGEVSP